MKKLLGILFLMNLVVLFSCGNRENSNTNIETKDSVSVAKENPPVIKPKENDTVSYIYNYVMNPVNKNKFVSIKELQPGTTLAEVKMPNGKIIEIECMLYENGKSIVFRSQTNKKFYIQDDFLDKDLEYATDKGDFNALMSDWLEDEPAEDSNRPTILSGMASSLEALNYWNKQYSKLLLDFTSKYGYKKI